MASDCKHEPDLEIEVSDISVLKCVGYYSIGTVRICRHCNVLYVELVDWYKQRQPAVELDGDEG